MLTILQCNNAAVKDKQYKLADEKGLYLLVKTNGGKYWRMDYRYADKRKTLALGVYPETTLKLARERRDDARRSLADGTDPSSEKREEKQALKVAHANNFEAVAREWHESKVNNLLPKYAEKVIGSLVADVFPTIGKRPISEITAAELLVVLRKIEVRGALETLKRVRQRCSDVFLYAIATGRTTSNPAEGLHKAVKSQKAEHRPALRVSELRDFFIRLDAVRISQPIKLAMRLLTLTFVRPAELRGASWEEFDLDGGLWVIPAERDRSRGLVGMKMKEAHTIPLNSQSVAILRELQEYSGFRELVFPNRNDPRRPISDGTLNSALRAMGYTSDQACGHGFRATATSGLLDLGFKPEVIDRQLAHRERNQVFGAYSHMAEYMTERRQLMQAWGDYVASLEAGANVIPIRRTVA